ncbi:molybdate transport system permease protein [Bathymodiolus platifrons methanotrophic gill symbiont]|uniref:molybdate ABC transporter permease subunit n=1 Tax=Bathymodiolus platifrons methanotrophic gill symbiont TaxID=113268 RepID=UPI000B418A93|nr:molybdate ABC transporter permease subunit [Bathymodiolus platifrons methanotrophic gill symbiont]MCK5871062.1 molybdate ABC transporter permease subunit [Methyloprofundus sp.]TXK94681.1 molybdate ABC transporter permease subunit [Methylococcaceae bacterium CS5]TXK95812.1 molybdate ABC transporter permease subunit [Methylococcaceae bacterium CS4]TXL04436.1 molybdate ABC transporter permease subunit [Methylococcaceae bacterium CS1]TXL04777.1 molybdate ABC transporter permease subunit [Methyl
MDWQALTLSIKLSLVTLIFLLPIGIFFGRWLAYRQFFGKSLLQTILALPLVLPPTVLGYYLLVAFSPNQGFGLWLANTFGTTLVFNFQGLVLASIIFNLPFAIQPMLRAFAAIPREIREAAACCGMPPAQVLWKIELPLAWPGIISAMVMCFAHTLGEFGIVLMVGGNIPAETQTIAISIYDRVQAFDDQSAAIMSFSLLLFSMITISFTYWLSERHQHPYV